MSNNEQKAAFFKEKLIQNEILAANGYTLTEEAWKLFGTELHGEKEQPYFCMELSSRNRALIISLHFSARTELVNVLLKNTVDQDLFMLTDWMAYYDEWKDKQQMFNLDTYSEYFDVAVTAFFENLTTLLGSPHLRPLLEGKDWKEIHLDWGDMK